MSEQPSSETLLYAFLVKRPQDREAWAVLFTDKTRATEYPSRASDVIEVRIPYDGKVMP